MRALTVMAAMVTAIALFGCNNGLGSAALAEVIGSEAGSTEGMFGAFNENETFNGVSLSKYATGLKYDWPDIDNTNADEFMEVGLSGTIKFYEDGYYIPFILGDDYQTNWGIGKREGNVCLVKVTPVSEAWNGVYASVSKNGVETWLHIGCSNLRFDATGDKRPLVEAYYAASYVDNLNISKSVYGDEEVSISGDFKRMQGKVLDAQYGYEDTFADGYYLPVIFHDSFRWMTVSGVGYDSKLKIDGTRPLYLLYLGDSLGVTHSYGVKFGIGGEDDIYAVTISVTLNSSYSELPSTTQGDSDDEQGND